MDTALVILVLLTVLVTAVWIFRRRRDAINPMINQGVPDLYRVGTLGRPPTAVQRGGVQGRTVSRLTRFESGRATPADVDFTSPPELFNSPEPSPREPSPHTHHVAPFCAEAPLSGHEAHHSGGACAEAPLSGHDAHHSTSSFDSGYSTDWSSGGGFDGGGHHH